MDAISILIHFSFSRYQPYRGIFIKRDLWPRSRHLRQSWAHGGLVLTSDLFGCTGFYNPGTLYRRKHTKLGTMATEITGYRATEIMGIR